MVKKHMIDDIEAILAAIFSLLVMLFLIIGTVGYVFNIVKLCNADFKEPYNEEVIRATGIVVPVVGAVIGYANFENNEEDE